MTNNTTTGRHALTNIVPPRRHTFNIGRIEVAPADAWKNPDLKFVIRDAGLWSGVLHATREDAAAQLEQLYRCAFCNDVHKFGSAKAIRCTAENG